MAVPLTLKVFKGETLVTSKDFERDIIKIGRLSSAHLCLEDEKVSRIHSVIEVSPDGSLSIIDMGSVEGTYVNGKRVNKGKVAFGDEIKVGGTTIRLESAAAVAAVNMAAAVSSSDVTTRVEVSAADMQAASAHLAQAAAAPVAAPAPVAVAAPAPAPVAAPAPAMDPSFASTEQNAVVAPVAAELPVEEEAPRARVARKSSKASGPLGAAVSFRWGDQRVGEYFLPSGKASLHWNEALMLAMLRPIKPLAAKSLLEQLPESRETVTVGTGSGVDLAMSDAKLSNPKMTVLKKHSDLHTFSVSFTGKMKGELVRKGETLDLNAVIESGKATSDGGAYSLVLEHDDFFWADLGGIIMEVQFQPAPKRVYVPLADSVDYRVLNIFLLMFFLSTMFVISAMNRSGDGEEFADELSGDNSRLAKLIIKPPETQKNKFLEQLNQQKEKQKEKAGEKAAKQKNEEGQMGKKEAPKTQNRTAPQGQKDKKDEARALTAKIFGGSKGGVSTLFGSAGLGGELKSAMGNMFGAKAGDSGGFGGLGIRGGGGGGGGTGDTIGIGAIGTKGRGGGTASYGSGVGVLGGKQSVDVGITSSEPVVMGSLDKELIRQVIQRNRSQIRFCYESQLTKYPKLNGKVAVKFVINADGAVVSSTVAQSTAGNAELETCVAGRVRTWQFPKPKGGGVVVVTYPFIFKASGE